jgi:calpain-15
VNNHSYTVLEVQEVDNKEGVKEKLLKIRNPWGKGEWQGRWSDSSDTWTPKLR